MNKLKLRDMVIFGMLGGVMYVLKVIMEAFPNIHPIGVFTVALTVVYRKRALYPLYICVFLIGLFNGFGTWWYPYLYLWLPLWGVTMLLPKNMNKVVAPIVYCIVCGLHGLLFGTLYAPFQALVFGLNFKSTIAWIIAGLPWDAVHCFGNTVCGLLIVPLINVLKLAEKTNA